MADEHTTGPLRRRDDDLTINEWRLLQLEHRVESIDTRLVERREFDDLKGDVNKLFDRIDGLRVWIVGVGFSVAGVVVAAVTLLQAVRAH